MDPEIIKHLARGAIPPAVFSLVAFGLLWWRRERASQDGMLAASVAPRTSGHPGAAPSSAAPGIRRSLLHVLLFVIAYIPTHYFVLGTVWPPASASDWLPIIAVIAAGLGLLMTMKRPPEVVRWAVFAVMLGGIGWVSAKDLIQSWTTAETAIHLGMFAGVSLVAAWSVVRLTRGAPGPAPVLLVLLPVAAASQVLVLAYSCLLLGQATGIAAALMGGVLAIALWRRSLVLGVPAALWAMLMALTCMFHGVLYGDAKLAWLYPLLVAASPVAVLTARRVMSHKSARHRTIIELAAATLPLAAAMALAIINREAPSDY